MLWLWPVLRLTPSSTTPAWKVAVDTERPEFPGLEKLSTVLQCVPFPFPLGEHGIRTLTSEETSRETQFLDLVPLH